MRRRLRLALNLGARYFPYALSAGLLITVILGFEDERLIECARLEVIGLGMLLALVINGLLAGFKWFLVLRWTGVEVGLTSALRLWLGLLPATFFAPLQTGHALYPVVLHNAVGLSWYRAIEVTVYDKVLNLVAILALIALGQLLIPAGHPLRHAPFWVLGTLAVVLFFWDQPVLGLLRRLRYVREHSALVGSPLPFRRKAALIGLAMLCQSSDAWSMLIACEALRLDVDSALVLGAFPVIMLLAHAPISFSGIGVRATLVPLLLGATFSPDEGRAAGALVTYLEYIWPALFGLVALRPVLHALRIRVRPVEEE